MTKKQKEIVNETTGEVLEIDKVIIHKTVLPSRFRTCCLS